MKNTNPTVTILQCVCVYMSCLRPRTNTPTCQRALDWEPADGALNANHTVYVCTSVCYVCTCECAHLSTIRLMFINTFCCVEWNCSEPWHRTACFSGLDVHAWVCVLAWPCDTELSKLSGWLSATLWLMTVQSISFLWRNKDLQKHWETHNKAGTILKNRLLGLATKQSIL